MKESKVLKAVHRSLASGGGGGGGCARVTARGPRGREPCVSSYTRRKRLSLTFNTFQLAPPQPCAPTPWTLHCSSKASARNCGHPSSRLVVFVWRVPQTITREQLASGGRGPRMATAQVGSLPETTFRRACVLCDPARSKSSRKAPRRLRCKITKEILFRVDDVFVKPLSLHHTPRINLILEQLHCATY